MTSPAYASIGLWLESLGGDRRVDDITHADIERLCADLNAFGAVYTTSCGECGKLFNSRGTDMCPTCTNHMIASMDPDHQCDEHCCTDYGQVPNENRSTP